MKKFLQSIYRYITDPIYRRILRDVTLEMQRQNINSIEMQEEFFQCVLDELIAVSAQVDLYKLKLESAGLLRVDATDVISDAPLDDTQIEKIVTETTYKGRSFLDIAKTYNVSPGTVAILQAKYFGLNASAIARMRALETQLDDVLKENVLLGRIAQESAAQSDRNTAQLTSISPANNQLQKI